MFFAELFAELLLLYEDLKFWKKKRARRKYEKENNLPKKVMINPYVRIYILAVVILSLSGGLGLIIFTWNSGENKTIEKLTIINELLEAEKRQLKAYPSLLEQIERNNPMRKNLLSDGWGNAFHYRTIENGLSYTLISKGKDGKLYTNDDIELK